MKRNLILLHGWGVNSRVWDRILPCLSETFKVTAIDLPGYGSMVDHEPGENLDHLANNVLSRAPESATWCGWSLGGMVAMAAALLNPDRIEKLSLVCTTPKFLQGDGWAYGSSETAMANLATQFERNYSKALARFFLLQLGTHPDAREMSRQLAAGAIEGATPRWATLKQGLSVLGNTDLRKSVRTINLPTEIIVGTEDRVIPADAGRFLASQIPKATLHEVNAGHVPFLTSPEWFVDHLKKNAEANL